MNTIVITNVSDELWLTITDALNRSLPGPSGGRVDPTSGTTATASSAPVIVARPPAPSSADVGGSKDRGIITPGAWMRSEVTLLQENLRMDRGAAQAAAIELALASTRRRVSREQILALPGRIGTGLRGFSRPLRRVEMAMIERGQLEPRRRDALLVPEMIAGTAIAYRLGADIADDTAPE